MLTSFCGIKIYTDNNIGWKSIQYRFPKSKKKRIRKKFAKKYRRSIQEPCGKFIELPDMFTRRSEKCIIANDAYLKELKSMSTFKVPVVKFTLEKHPNADKLSIARVADWICVCKTEDFKDESLAVYVPIHSVAPADHPLLGFLEGKKVKTVRLRGIISQGVLLPASEVEKHYGVKLKEGEDCADLLGVKKWEPPVQKEKLRSGFTIQGPDWFQKYTDLEHLANFPGIFGESEIIYVTEKLHGTSARFGLENGTPWIGSRNRVLPVAPFVSKAEQARWNGRSLFQKILDRVRGVNQPQLTIPDETVWHKVFRDIVANLLQLRQRLSDKPFAVYGEIVGPGIQNFTYGLTEPTFFLYDIGVLFDDGFKFLNYQTRMDLAQKCGFRTVPLLGVCISTEEAKGFIGSRSTIDSATTMEGIVIEPGKERFDPRLGRVKLKVISPEYDMKDTSDKTEDSIDA